MEGEGKDGRGGREREGGGLKGRKREGRGGRGREGERREGRGGRGKWEERGRGGGALIRIFCVNIEDGHAIYMRTCTRPIGRQCVGAFKCAVTTLFTSYSGVLCKIASESVPLSPHVSDPLHTSSIHLIQGQFTILTYVFIEPCSQHINDATSCTYMVSTLPNW